MWYVGCSSRFFSLCHTFQQKMSFYVISLKCIKYIKPSKKWQNSTRSRRRVFKTLLGSFTFCSIWVSTFNEISFLKVFFNQIKLLIILKYCLKIAMMKSMKMFVLFTWLICDWNYTRKKNILQKNKEFVNQYNSVMMTFQHKLSKKGEPGGSFIIIK